MGNPSYGKGYFTGYDEGLKDGIDIGTQNEITKGTAQGLAIGIPAGMAILLIIQNILDKVKEKRTQAALKSAKDKCGMVALREAVEKFKEQETNEEHSNDG